MTALVWYRGLWREALFAATVLDLLRARLLLLVVNLAITLGLWLVVASLSLLVKP